MLSYGKDNPEKGNKQLQITYFKGLAFIICYFSFFLISKFNTKEKKAVLKNGPKIWTLPKNIYEWQIKTWKDAQNITSHHGNANWNHNELSPIKMA